MADPATEAFVQADKDFGISKSVGSTPSFLIEGNDKLFEGSAPEVLTELTTAIQTAAGAN
jgi:hypothetical protein